MKSIRGVVLAMIMGCGVSDSDTTITADTLHNITPCDLTSWGAGPSDEPTPVDCELPCATKPVETGSGCFGDFVNHETGSAELAHGAQCGSTFVVAGIQGCCGNENLSDDDPVSAIRFIVCGIGSDNPGSD